MGVADPPSWYHSFGPHGAIAEELGPSVTHVGGVRLLKCERVCVRSDTADVDLEMCCWVPGSAAAVAGDQLPSSWSMWVWSTWAAAMVA